MKTMRGMTMNEEERVFLLYLIETERITNINSLAARLPYGAQDVIAEVVKAGYKVTTDDFRVVV